MTIPGVRRGGGPRRPEGVLNTRKMSMRHGSILPTNIHNINRPGKVWRVSVRKGMCNVGGHLVHKDQKRVRQGTKME